MFISSRSIESVALIGARIAEALRQQVVGRRRDCHEIVAVRIEVHFAGVVVAVAVGIAPPIGGRADRVLVVGIGEGVAGRMIVAAPRSLDHGLAVAEQVVGQAEPGRELAPRIASTSGYDPALPNCPCALVCAGTHEWNVSQRRPRLTVVRSPSRHVSWTNAPPSLRRFDGKMRIVVGPDLQRCAVVEDQIVVAVRCVGPAGRVVLNHQMEAALQLVAAEQRSRRKEGRGAGRPPALARALVLGMIRAEREPGELVGCVAVRRARPAGRCSSRRSAAGRPAH